MPWTLLIRLVTGVLFWRLAGARRRAAAGRAFGAAAARNPAVAQRVRDARETATLATRLLVVMGFGLATALCVAAGTSSVVLSPRWLGGVLLGVGTFFAVLTFREARLARHIVITRRLRRQATRLRSEI